MIMLIVAALVLLGFGIMMWQFRRGLARWMTEQLRLAMKSAQEEFLILAAQRLEVERSQQAGALDVRNKEIEKVVQGLERQLGRYEELISQFERDRAQKYGSLEQQIQQTAAQTERLRAATAQLTTMLGNSKIRGQWGEKAAEDILRVCGLQEHVHYVKQRNAPLGRPDFTFVLPQEHKFYMDVKFPLDNYLKLMNCEREEEGRLYKEQFLRDVRLHMRELERRDYAASDQTSPDYILMFIPNEQVYSAVNEWMPGIIDEALSKQIVVCGPWTLYAHIRLIWQAWEQYYHAQTIGEIASTVQEFLKAYGRFKERFQDLGARLDSARQRYEEITRTSYAQLDRKIEQIEAYRRGEGHEAPPVLEEAREPLPMKELAHG